MAANPAPDSNDDAVVRDLRRQVQSTPPLTAGEQRELLAKAHHGDRESLDRLVAGSLHMVIRLATSRVDRGLSMADLVQEGSLGLLQAAQSFASSSESDFARFAELKVVEQMDAAIAAEAAAVRDAELLVAAATDYERTELALRRELHRTATEAEIARKLEWSVERTRYVAQVVADARRAHDEEMLAFIDPDSIEIDDVIEG